MRSVRLPIVVPRLEVSTRMKSANELPLRVRGRRVAVVRATPCGVPAVTVVVSCRPGAGCVNRHRRPGHQVPRSRSSSSRRRRSCPSPFVSSGSSVRLGGVCRCRRGLAARSLHLIRLVSLNVIQTAALGLYCSRATAYGAPIMRQPNYAFERTGEPSVQARVRQSQLLRPSARLRRRVPAAQRER
jgi:hypothetical protein